MDKKSKVKRLIGEGLEEVRAIEEGRGSAEAFAAKIEELSEAMKEAGTEEGMRPYEALCRIRNTPLKLLATLKRDKPQPR